MNRHDFRPQSILFGLALLACCRPAVNITSDGVRDGANTKDDASIASSGSSGSDANSSRAGAVDPLASVTPLPGEPDGEQLDSVRLVENSCAENEAKVREDRVQKMRTAVDAEYAAWRARRPCNAGDNGKVCYNGYEWAPPAVRYPPPMPMTRPSYGNYGGATGASNPAVTHFYPMRSTSVPSPTAGAPLVPTPPPAAMAADSAPAYESAVASRAPQPKAPPTKAASASGTNNQVAAVDEADIVKNDGTYVYIATNGALRIIEAMHPRLLSVTQVTGSPREMLVENDRAVLFVANGNTSQKQCKYAYDCEVGSDGTSTTVLVYDIHDRLHPRKVREIALSGSLMAARRIGDTVHTVVADDRKRGTPSYPTSIAWGDTCATCVSDTGTVHEKFEQLKRDNEARILADAIEFPTVTENGATRQLCEVMHSPISDGQSFTSVVSFDLVHDTAPVTTATLESRPGTVFASEQGLYVAVTHHKNAGTNRWYAFAESEEEISDIHKFRIGSSPSMTKYRGSGVVPGHVLNQFAMDEWNGHLRVATTRGKVPNPNVSSSISILSPSQGGNLVRVGAVDHIAPSEDIRAVRFDDDRGYIVTFKKTDPLFVVDLSHANDPKVLGELKIPGFSTYLHRIDPTHLLSIGFDAQDHGSFAFFDGLLLQLFDVTNPLEPTLLHREKIGSRGSSSEAATDHLAFNYMPSRGLLAIPVTTCQGGGDGTYGDQLTFSGLSVYDVSIAHGFHRLGGVDHGRSGANCQTWWANAQSMVKRSIFMDDLVFSIADDRMKVQHLSHLGKDLADISLTGGRSDGEESEPEVMLEK